MKITKELVELALSHVESTDSQALGKLLCALPDHAEKYPFKTRAEVILAARIRELENILQENNLIV